MRRRLLLGALGFGCLLVVVEIMQLLYPAGRLLPFVRINGENYGTQRVQSAADSLQTKYQSAYVELQTGGAASAASFQELGLDVQPSPTALAASKYSLAQRLIPFSSLAIMLVRDEPMQVRIDNERVRYFAEQLEQQGMIPAVNATVTVNGDKVALTPGKPRQLFPAEVTHQAILDARMSPALRITLAPLAQVADVSDSDAAGMQNAAKQILSTPLNLRIGSKEVAVDKTTIASWLDFPVTDGKLELVFASEKLKDHVASMQSLVYQAPTAVRITTLDGRETGRTVGANGTGIDLGAAAAQIEAQLRSLTGGTVTLKTVALAPGTTYDRNYSATSAGLAALLGDLAAGKDYGVAVAELGGKARIASMGGNKVYLAASTYKLFVAYGVFQLIASGEMHWSDSISGLTANACLEKMIVNSDNPCATAFGERIGWSRVQSMMHGLGLGSTTLKASAKYTTANDLSLYLQKLANGSLLSVADSERLLGYMKRQIYRKGIPAGTKVAVADKVGFLYGYIHDAGIVYGPSGPYVMVIMTNNSGWSTMSDTARQIHTYITR